MGRRSTQATGQALAEVVTSATERAGELAGRARDSAGELASAAGERAAPLRDRVVDSAGELAVAAAPVVGSAVETVSGVLEDALERGGAAWDALRGDPVGPPVAVRRWPWALGAALLGAAAGAAAAAVVRKVAPADAPGAQEPHELRAVVDTAEPAATTRPRPAKAGPTTGRPLDEQAAAPVPAPPVERTTFEL